MRLADLLQLPDLMLSVRGSYTTPWDCALLENVPCMPFVRTLVTSSLWCRSEQSNTASSATLLHLYEQLRANVAGTLDTTAGITNARAQTAASQVRHLYASQAQDGDSALLCSSQLQHDADVAQADGRLPILTCCACHEQPLAC